MSDWNGWTSLTNWLSGGIIKNFYEMISFMMSYASLLLTGVVQLLLLTAALKL